MTATVLPSLNHQESNKTSNRPYHSTSHLATTNLVTTSTEHLPQLKHGEALLNQSQTINDSKVRKDPDGNRLPMTPQGTLALSS